MKKKEEIVFDKGRGKMSMKQMCAAKAAGMSKGRGWSVAGQRGGDGTDGGDDRLMRRT